MMRRIKCVRAVLLAGVVFTVQIAKAGVPTLAEPVVPIVNDQAAVFGAREGAWGMSLSPDGQHVLFLGAGHDSNAALQVASADGGGAARVIASANGMPMSLQRCDWADNSRIVCSVRYSEEEGGVRLGYEQLLALDIDGKNMLSLAAPASADSLRGSQFAGDVIDWRQGETGKVLMERDHVPEATIGTHIADQQDGLAVDLVDTRTNKATGIEHADHRAEYYISDGRGVVRFKLLAGIKGSTGYASGTDNFFYRKQGSTEWLPFSTVPLDGPGLRPVSVDPVGNVAYCFDRVSGRDALYRVALDGSMKTELVYANPKLDVDEVVRLGRQPRLIGVSILADKPEVVYFDKEYDALAASLAKAIPTLPLINFTGSSDDEKRLLIHAGSDDDPGRYFVFDRTTHRLNEIALVRPDLEHVRLAKQVPITYPAADGTPIPAYLTLPPGSAGKHIPAIVMPHGGPDSRDSWGFDWLVQFFAARGYAVLQPEYRGSTGYGESWMMKKGFKSWRTAIGDVTDAGRWLIAQGIAAPDHLGVVGWSYGGYAALQANVLDPDLFKAVVAIAPVTDLPLLEQEADKYTNGSIVRDTVGTGQLSLDASPSRHAALFRAPVLMFHGTVDQNVDPGQSREMDSRLRAAGKQSELVIYRNLDHQLRDGDVRADMLRKSDAFLRQSMHIAS
jgi:dipeptidyl aminopeptidase/acylaminoacyl peptidase